MDRYTVEIRERDDKRRGSDGMIMRSVLASTGNHAQQEAMALVREMSKAAGKDYGLVRVY